VITDKSTLLPLQNSACSYFLSLLITELESDASSSNLTDGIITKSFFNQCLKIHTLNGFSGFTVHHLCRHHGADLHSTSVCSQTDVPNYEGLQKGLK